jgi:hypothetical protein
MKIKLNTGKTVSLEAFHQTQTYSGLLVGTPSKASNDILIEKINYPKDWGNQTCILNKSDLYVSENILKPIIYCAWLSAEPIENKNNQYDGSSVVVIWIGNEHLDKSIQEIIVDGIGNFVWDKYASNFQF